MRASGRPRPAGPSSARPRGGGAPDGAGVERRAGSSSGWPSIAPSFRDPAILSGDRDPNRSRSPRHPTIMIGPVLAALGALWVVVIMWDAFEALVLPRRVWRRLRPTRMFYRASWRLWSAVARRMPPGGRRETYLRDRKR